MIKNLQNIIDYIPYISFDIDNSFSTLRSDPYELKQDMLQIKLNDNIIADIGWLPDFDLKGNFQVRVVKNHDWENLLFFSTAKDDKELLPILNTLIDQYAKIQIQEKWTSNQSKKTRSIESDP